MSTDLERTGLYATAAAGPTTLLSGGGGGTHVHRRISWAAIAGGVLVVVALQLLFTLLGSGIGFSTVDVGTGGTPSAGSLGTGAGIWWVVSSCLALALGGFVSAWLAGIEIRFDGMLHGAVTWSVATLLTFWLLSSAVGGVLGGGFAAISSVVSAAGSGISKAAEPLAQAAGVSPDAVGQQATAYLQPVNPDPAAMSPEVAQKAIATNLATYAGGGSDAPAAKDRVIDIIAAQTHVSHDDALKRFNDTQAKLEQARNTAVQKAKEAANTAAAAASKTSFAAFGVLLLGGIAAVVGGATAVQRRTASIRRTV